MHQLGFKGQFRVQHFRQSARIGDYTIDNAVVNQGKNHILDVMFGGVAATNPWSIGLIDNAGFTGLAVTDTIGSHPGWAESVAYSEATRIAWSDDAASGQSKTNSVTDDFSINATASIYGLFIVSENTKGGGAGFLWSTAQFTSSPVPVVNLDTLRVTYTLSVN